MPETRIQRTRSIYEPTDFVFYDGTVRLTVRPRLKRLPHVWPMLRLCWQHRIGVVASFHLIWTMLTF